MGKKEKLIEQLRTNPKSFTMEKMATLLGYFTYHASNKGKTSGSRIMFVSDKYPPILLHKPHPQKELAEYQVKQIIEILEKEGLI